MSENNDGKFNPNQPIKGGKFGFIFFIIVFVFFCLYLVLCRQQTVPDEISYSNFLNLVQAGEITEVRIVDQKEIRGVYDRKSEHQGVFKSVIPYFDEGLVSFLEKHNVTVIGVATKQNKFFSYLLQLLPWIITMVFILFIFRQNAAQSSKGNQFGKSRARIYDGSKKVTFQDVAGQEEAKVELSEIIDFLKNPKKFVAMGAKIPTGVLLVGSPGTGKTLLARAVAGEAGVSFLHISGSDFVEMFVGVGASRVRDLFEQGRKRAPCIIFIDEIDAVGRARGAGFGGGHDEREQTLNQMLVEMDGFDTKDGIIVLAATNRPDVLDPALLRPGRFDRQVVVSLPTIKEREAILRVHAKKIPLGEDVDLHHLARATSGMSGADLASVVNEAALFAARSEKDKVSFSEFELAIDKVLMGIAKKSMIIPEKERRMTSYHESGHALPYYYLKNVSPLHKVTIIPHGKALGLTVGLPAEDSYSYTKNWILDQLVILFGGYAAESVIFGETTTGTQNDIQRATDFAHRMVCEWGMSDVGAVCYGQEDEPLFMGKEIARHKGYSEFIAQKIDMAVSKILEDAKNKAVSILTEHKDELVKLAETLLERETMSDSEVRDLLNIKPIENNSLSADNA